MGFFPGKARAWLLLPICLVIGSPARAERQGGTLLIYAPDNPASMSPLEESTAYAVAPAMGIFNNLIVFDQSISQNSLETLRPDLATGWSWNGDRTRLVLQLRQGVRWHDGRPFTAKDVACTWNYQIEKSSARLRANPRQSLYKNLERIETNGDFEVTFHLKRPQPAFPVLLGGGVSPVYPCHVPPDVMRRHPIGTGPFKFMEFKPNQFVRVARNSDYWKPGRPFLDAIEWTIMRSTGTAMLAFAAGNVDMTFPTHLGIAQMRDLQKQVPTARCEVTPGTLNRHVIINRNVPPFDNPDIRRALALAIDRQAFINIISEGQGEIGAILQPAPAGAWGIPPERMRDLPGYDTDIEKNRLRARALMEGQGYGPAKPLKFKLTTRDIQSYRDPAVILLDQLRQVYLTGELEVVETGAYFPKLRRKDFVVGLNIQTSGPDPDQVFDLFYGCGSSVNWDGYCNPEIDSLIEQQSIEGSVAKRKQLHWQIEKKLGEEATRPIIFYAHGATCWHPHVKGYTVVANSFFNGYRLENVWFDK